MLKFKNPFSTDDNTNNKRQIPVVAMRGMTILPHMVIHFDLSRKNSIASVEKAMTTDQTILVVTQRDPDEKELSLDKLYEFGTIANVRQIAKMPGNIVRVVVEATSRGKLLSFEKTEDDYWLSSIEICEDPEASGTIYEAMSKELSDNFKEYCTVHPKVGKSCEKLFLAGYALPRLIDELAANIPIEYKQKQQVLSAYELQGRYDAINDILLHETEVAKIRGDLQNGIKARVEKNQKEYVLREQLHYIKDELGESADVDQDATEFEEKLSKLEAAEEIKDKISKEIKRFKMLSATSQESAVSRDYIETLLSLPWDAKKPENRDLKNAAKVLEEDHYGLEKVKERVLEFLAVRNLTEKGESPIICLVGPPGCGKTSIAKSIARALDKEYVRICLGGVRDEAEIRGHRRTYVGAMPGRIIAGIKNAGVANPLMLLDEIDKISSDYKGDTSAALLEVLDSEQNANFRDHYVGLPVDLSDVLFIATANDLSNVSRPLLDRMEIVEVPGYTENEKLHIAKDYLVPKQLSKHGIKKDQLTITDGALKAIIGGYTKEAGVRALERNIGKICRKSARRIFEDKEKSIKAGARNIEDFLGKVKYIRDMAAEKDEIGIVRGLAWTSVGGDTLEIEVNIMPGKGELILTGQLGDVMKESAMAGITYIRSISDQVGVDASFYKENDIHIHIPEGATPKDGPSAGITMATAVLSAITQNAVRCDTAMTGEITLRGRVLPIGGLKEKLLAAKLAGIKQVLVPEKNKKDIDEIDKEILDGLKIVLVATMDDVIKNAFTVDIYAKKGKKKR